MTMHPEGYLLSEVRRLQRTYPAEKLAMVITDYVEKRYYPRVQCAPDLKEIIDNENDIMSDYQIWDKIVTVVGTHCQMTWKEMSARSRKKELVMARKLIIYFACFRTKLCLRYIGYKFGFNHATVIHSRQRIIAEMAQDEDLRETIEFLNSQI